MGPSWSRCIVYWKRRTLSMRMSVKWTTSCGCSSLKTLLIEQFGWKTILRYTETPSWCEDTYRICFTEILWPWIAIGTSELISSYCLPFGEYKVNELPTIRSRNFVLCHAQRTGSGEILSVLKQRWPLSGSSYSEFYLWTPWFRVVPLSALNFVLVRSHPTNVNLGRSWRDPGLGNNPVRGGIGATCSGSCELFFPKTAVYLQPNCESSGLCCLL